MEDFKCIFDLIESKEKDFFNWLSNLENFAFLNGFENMRNVIQMGLKQLFKKKKNLPETAQRLNYKKTYKKSPSGKVPKPQ